MSRKNIKKSAKKTNFDAELSSLDDEPSINTSLNDAAMGIESVGITAEAAETTGAELGEVNVMRAERADSPDELQKTADSCIEQKEFAKNAEKTSRMSSANYLKAKSADFLRKLGKIAQSCDDQLEYFRKSVSEMLDSVYALSVRTASRIQTRMRAAHRAHDRFRRNNWMLRRLIMSEKAMNKIKESQFAEAAETLTAFEKSAAVRFDALRMKGRKLVKKYEAFVDSAIQYFIEHRKKCTIAAGTVMMFMVAFAITINAATVYNYSYHGTQLGTVKNKTEIKEAVAQVPESVDTNVNVAVDPEVDVTYTKELKFSANTDTAETAADKIANVDNLTGDGYSIIVDGKTAALVDSEETANKILEQVKLYYCTVDSEGNKVVDGVPVDESSIDSESSSITSTESDLSSDLNKVAALHSIIDAASVSSEVPQSDAAASAGTPAQAVADNVQRQMEDEQAQGISEPSQQDTQGAQDAGEADPKAQAVDAASAVLTEGSEIGDSGHPLVFSTEVAPDDLIFDEEVKIEPVVANVDAFSDYDTASKVFLNDDGSSKLLTVSTSEIQIFTRTVEFETVYEDDASMYEGETKVKTEGVNGTSRVTAQIYRVNGEEIARDILSEIVIEEPVDQVILKGTKEKPTTDPTGSFICPANGRFSSGFGARWGRKHQGIDIAGAYGSNILAADGGTVIYAGYNSGGYGNLVKIDHGNGYVTYYGHNSSLCVSVGDKVAKGQVIAKMGSTGRSTGNHCHFEIRKGGTPVNPTNYISVG